MIDFYMRPKGGCQAETTLIAFRDLTAFLNFVREAEEVTVTYEDNMPVVLVEG